MTSPDSTKVSSMKPLSTGGVLVAPHGTTLPPETAPTGSITLDSAFVALGYMEQGANVNNAENRESSDVSAWGGVLVTNITTSRKETYAFKPIEQNVAVWKLRYGSDNVSGDDANASIVHDGSAYDEFHSIIIAEKLGDGRVHLTVIPKAKLDSAEDISHSDSNPYGYGMTFAAIAYDGNKTSYELYYTPEDATTTTTTA